MAECGGRNEKQPAQSVFLAEPLIPTAAPSSLPVGESQREGNKPQGLYKHHPITKMTPPKKLLTADNPALHQRAKALRKEMSEAEAKLWQHLRAGRLNGYKFRRQQPMGSYIVDFMCLTPKLIVEADGGQHTEQAAYDHARTAYLNSLGFTVLRFWNHEILQQTDDVLAEILRVLQELEKQPAR